MDEHLKTDLQYAQETLQSARDWDCQPGNNQEVVIAYLIVTMEHVLSHLESQLPQEAPQASEKPSSPAIETEAGTKPTSNTSYSLWCLVNQRGYLMPSALQAISDWLNSVELPGNEQVEVTLSIRTPKASMPPDGLPSPSTAELTRGASGHAGEHDNLDGPCACGGWHTPAAPEPSPAPSHEARECRSPHPHCSACLCRLIEGHYGPCGDWRHDPISQSSQEGVQD